MGRNSPTVFGAILTGTGYTSFGANNTKNRIVRTWVNLLDRNLPVGRPLNKDMFSPTSSGEEVVFKLKFEACS